MGLLPTFKMVRGNLMLFLLYLANVDTRPKGLLSSFVYVFGWIMILSYLFIIF